MTSLPCSYSPTIHPPHSSHYYLKNKLHYTPQTFQQLPIILRIKLKLHRTLGLLLDFPASSTTLSTLTVPHRPALSRPGSFSPQGLCTWISPTWNTLCSTHISAGQESCHHAGLYSCHLLREACSDPQPYSSSPTTRLLSISSHCFIFLRTSAIICLITCYCLSPLIGQDWVCFCSSLYPQSLE